MWSWIKNRSLDKALLNSLLRRAGELQARWMTKVIYALKILLLANQFKLIARETSGLKQFVFLALDMYVNTWFAASVPSSSPADNLQPLQDLAKYHDAKISATCLGVFGRHLWYPSEYLVGP